MSDLISHISRINMDDNYSYVIAVFIIFCFLILMNVLIPYLKLKKVIKNNKQGYLED